MKKLLIFLFFTHNLYAQDKNKQRPIIIGNKVIIQSKILGQDRRIYVSLPSYYDGNSTHYPVIYHLDGLGFFEMISGNSKELAMFHAIPDSIVVGINQQNRYKELKLPESLNFLKFINYEVIPFIDKNYRTTSQRTIIGHSLGGTFVLTALLESPEIYSSYIAISPVIGIENTPKVAEFKKYFKKNNKTIKNIYISKGNEKYPYDKNIPKLVKLLDKYVNKINWSYHKFPKKSHGSVVIPALIESLSDLYKGRIMPEINEIGLSEFSKLSQLEKIGGTNAIIKYYQTLSKNKGYKINIPTIIYSRIGFLYANNKKYKELLQWVEEQGRGNGYVNYYIGQNLIAQNRAEIAIKLFLLNSISNTSAKSWKSLAQAYEANKEYQQAVKYYQKAIDIAKASNDENLVKYEQLKKHVLEKQ